jgi:NAD(P)-dependent dehydrogenase (short-subunit alcohol dehydrogenase family)
VQQYNKVVARADALDINPSLEFMSLAKYYNNIEDVCNLLKLIDHPRSSLVLDTWHLWRNDSATFDNCPFHKINSQWISVVHYTDARKDLPREEQKDDARKIPGEGILDLSGFCNRLRSIDFCGWLSLNVYDRTLWDEDPLEVASRGIFSMRRTAEKSIIKNKIAVVTGSGSKITKAIIKSLENTYHIKKHKLRPESGCYHGDLSNENHVKEFFDNFKKIDLLMCCAGGFRINDKRPMPDDCLYISLEESHELFNRNFFTTFLCCKYAVPKMSPKSNIIIIGSAVVSKPRKNAEVGMYGCAKAAVHEYAIHLAKELEGKIRVNCIATDGHEIDKITYAVQDIINSNNNGEIIRLE